MIELTLAIVGGIALAYVVAYIGFTVLAVAFFARAMSGPRPKRRKRIRWTY